MKTAIWMAVCLALTGVVCLVIWTRNVELEVPADFRGLIRFRSDSSALPPKIGFFKLVVQVPESGDGRLPHLDVLRRVHHLKALSSNGSRLPVAFPGDRSTSIALHVMNTPPTDQVYYFVGNRDQLLIYLREHGNRLYSTHNR